MAPCSHCSILLKWVTCSNTDILDLDARIDQNSLFIRCSGNQTSSFEDIGQEAIIFETQGQGEYIQDGKTTGHRQYK